LVPIRTQKPGQQQQKHKSDQNDFKFLGFGADYFSAQNPVLSPSRETRKSKFMK
jgi:hypothetical protein